MIKRCVICDTEYEVAVDRYDNVTCSVACRSKLHRQRRKAEAERQARLSPNPDQRMMIWLKKHIPDAAHNLNKIKAIHGDEAFELANDSLRLLVEHLLNKRA